MRYLILILIFASCSTIPRKQEPTVTEPVILSTTPKPVGKLTGLVTFKCDTTCKPSEVAKVLEAEKKIQEVVSSQCFKDFMLSRPMIETNNRTSSEVYSHVSNLSGLVGVSMYFKRWTSAIAYRNPPSLKINLNRNYFTASKSVCDWASTMAHEGIAHALGNYTHSYYPTKDRQYSVPYSLNASFDSCCK
jgi:hypothetical protein